MKTSPYLILALLFFYTSIHIKAADKVAILITVSKYQNNEIPNTYASEDAETFSNSFYKMGFREVVHIKDTMATKQNIFNSFSKLNCKCTSNTSVVTFIQGRGKWLDDQDYFMPYDANSYDFNSFININKLAIELEANCAGNILLLTDISQSSLEDNNYLATIPKGGFQEPKNTCVIRAAGTGKYSYELPSGSSIFSYYFYKLICEPKFQRSSDSNNDGFFSTDELFQFLRDHTSKYITHSQNGKMRQIPTLNKSKNLKTWSIFSINNGIEPGIDFVRSLDSGEGNMPDEKALVIIPHKRTKYHESTTLERMRLTIKKENPKAVLPERGMDEEYFAVFDIGKWFETNKKFALIFFTQ